MLKSPPALPVRTRIPLAVWAVAGVITLFSLVSSLLHAAHFGATPHAEQALPKPWLLVAAQTNVLAIRALPSWPWTTASNNFAPCFASSIFTGVKSAARPRPSLSIST